MQVYNSHEEYLYNMFTYTSSEAKRLWKRTIKEQWNYECAYCGSEEQLTIDHVTPQSKGGTDFSINAVCCCRSCNQSKGHIPLEEWYKKQSFFSQSKLQKIKEWIAGNTAKPQLYTYGKRTNKVI